MKRQRLQNNLAGSYGYSAFETPSLATGSAAPGVNMAAGVGTQVHSGSLNEASLQHGMQPNMHSNLQPGIGAMSNLYQGNGFNSGSGLPMNMNGSRLSDDFGAAGMGLPGQIGQSLGSGLPPSMGQHLGQHMGQNMAQSLHPDMGPSMLHNIGSGIGQNMVPSMGGNLSMGPNMALEAQGGLSQALGQGMGISEGFPCVKLRGLPFDASEQDIAVWLETEPLDIIIVRRGLRSTGEAYILLRMPIQVELVLRKNKTYIGKRYVEVNLAKKLDFYKAIHAMVRDDAENSSAPQQSYDKHHRESEPRHARQASPVRRRHSSRDSSRDVVVSKHRSMEVNGSSDYEDHLLPSQKVHTGVLKMRGLPFAATPEDIVYWFNSAGLPIQPLTSERVHIVISSGGKPTGNGFVRFASAEESKAAMAKDRKTLGSRYIELFPCNQEEAADAM